MSSEELAQYKEDQKTKARAKYKEKCTCKICKRVVKPSQMGFDNFCRQCEDDRQEHTAWQWVENERRVPLPDAKARKHKNEWFYYQKKDTRPISQDEYEQLKAQYITLYDGWESIDLENTTYNGKLWILE